MGPWRSNARIPFCGLQHPETTPPSQKSTTSQTAPDGKRVYFYTRQAVEELRSIPRTQPNYQANIKEDEEWPRIPSPRAQRRADEIVAAWDRYAAAEEEAREQSGYGEIERTIRAHIKTLHDLENRIARTRANTYQGMLMKARMAAEDPACGSVEEQIESALRQRYSTTQFIGASLIRDVLHISGGQA